MKIWLLAACLIGLGSHTLSAGVLGLDLTSGAPTFGSGFQDVNLGWSFSTSGPVTVTALGFWDQGSNGLGQSHDVGLWILGGALQASATVNNGSDVVASASAAGRWLFTSITPVVLPAGTYVLGATPGTSVDHFLLNSTATTTPEITYDVARYNTDTGVLARPDGSNAGVDAGYIGPNLIIANQVPEPSTFALILFPLAAAGLVLRTRRP
ncbi:MAG: PEP-CTERM sorting domain-containing protein [Bryobacteraceae bacterium]|nr:PEP-CTERM sorting domain-containing protein [Bryobacteraceae bacterium]